jgi:hypothetical protein
LPPYCQECIGKTHALLCQHGRQRRRLNSSGPRGRFPSRGLRHREGWRQADDTLLPRVLTETLPTGVVQGVGLTKADLDIMIHGYYRARGWTAAGLIPEHKLHKLDIFDIVQASSR